MGKGKKPELTHISEKTLGVVKDHRRRLGRTEKAASSGGGLGSRSIQKIGAYERCFSSIKASGERKKKGGTRHLGYQTTTLYSCRRKKKGKRDGLNKRKQGGGESLRDSKDSGVMVKNEKRGT